MKTTPLMRRAGVYGLVAMAALGAVAHNTTAAHADEAPTPVVTQPADPWLDPKLPQTDQTKYSTVVWFVPGGAAAPWPQTFVSRGFGDRVDYIKAHHDDLKCGGHYQVDYYLTSDVAALVADNTLTEGEDYGKAIKWTTFDTATCEAPSPEPTPTETATPPVTPPTTTTPSPSTEPTAPPATSTSTPVAPTTPPSASVAPSASDAGMSSPATAASLAMTGSRDMTPFGIAAGIFLAAGIAFVSRAAVLRRRQKASK